MCCRGYTFCCISDLRLATLVIAVITLLANVTELAFLSWYVDFGIEQYMDFPSSDSTAVLAVLLFLLVTSITAVLLDIVLMFGALRRRHGMVQCWLYGYFWLQFTILYSYCFVIFFGIVTLFASIIGSVVIVYFWMVVHRYDLQLQQGHLRAVCANCNPSAITSYNLGSSRQLPSCENKKKVLGTLNLPPPYTSNP